MITIQQTVDIPADRRLTVDIPLEVPMGMTSVVLIFPQVGTSEAVDMDIINRNAERLNSEALDVLSHTFPSIEEIKAEAERKTKERLAGPSRDSLNRYAGCLADSAVFEGDAVAIQREMRGEAPALYPLDRREAINAIAWNHGKQNDSSRVYAGCLKGKHIFKGDPAAIQRKMRDEWQDARS